MKNRKNSGITLIALVVTIIVLILLSGITMSLVFGENGIIRKSNDSKAKSERAEAKELAQVDIVDWQTDKISKGENSDLNDSIIQGILTGKYYVKTAGATSFISKKGEHEIPYSELYNKVNRIPTKHPEQSSENEDIGIGTDGEPVNLDLWYYSLDEYEDGCYAWLKDEYSCGEFQTVYLGEFINGRIQGTVPKAIKRDDKVYSVISVDGAFADCAELIYAPEIPDTVCSMNSTFYNCTNLKTAPEIPDSVRELYCTFYNCKKINIAPEIPNGVTTMSKTFYGCNELTTAPIIPSSVREIDELFYNCYKLTGNLVFNCEYLSHTYDCLKGAATDENCDLKLSGSCSYLERILNTKSENSHISLLE